MIANDSNLDISDNDPETHEVLNKNEIDEDENSIDTDDSLQDFIDFFSHRNSTGLEESISFTYPLPSSLPSTTPPPPPSVISTTRNNEDDDDTTTIRKPSLPVPFSRKLTLSTLLEEDDLAPLFDGAGWAGTRVWSAAIWGIQYIMDHYYYRQVQREGSTRKLSLCELGCGLGVPGMIWHQFGGDVVLTEQESIMSQLTKNIRSNFPTTYLSPDYLDGGSNEGDNATSKMSDTSTSTSTTINTQLHTPHSIIQTHPLTWSRQSLHTLLTNSGYQKSGFDIVLNCDCVYEPLYGRSWEALIEVIDECLRVNPRCLVITSVERRAADGIGEFLERMEEGENVGCVEKVKVEEGKSLEMYVTRGVY